MWCILKGFLMDLLIALLKTAIVVKLSFYLHRIWSSQKTVYGMAVSKSMKRLPFLLCLVLSALLWQAFMLTLTTIMTHITSLPAYITLKLTLFVLTLIFSIFYTTIFSRRIQDFSMPTQLSLLWVTLFSFSVFYGVVKSTVFTLNTILVFLSLVVAFIPSTKRIRTSNKISHKYK